jgi:hypothetical protein
MDLALAIEKIYPNAQYFGSTTENSKTEFDNLNWLDERSKPSWKQVQDAWIKYETDLAKEIEIKTAAKSALLDRLGITAEEAQLLLS